MDHNTIKCFKRQPKARSPVTVELIYLSTRTEQASLPFALTHSNGLHLLHTMRFPDCIGGS